MNGTRKVPVGVLRLYTDRAYTHTGTHLRGAILRRFPDRQLLHNRRESGVAQLPEVRYLVEEGVPLVVAVGEGRDELLDLYRGIDELPVPDGAYTVTGVELANRPVELGVVSTDVSYRSITPWLGLNQRNHGLFQAAKFEGDRRELLARVIVGNMLVSLGQLGVRLGDDERIVVSVNEVATREIRVRSQTFLGFRLRFRSNVLWSPLLGLGKQVAKGFGRFGRDDSGFHRGARGASREPRLRA